MNDEILNTVVNEIAALMNVPASSLTPKTTLNEIGVDPLERLQLMIELEQLTQIQLEEADMKQFTTIQSIVDLLNERFQEAAA